MNPNPFQCQSPKLFAGNPSANFCHENNNRNFGSALDRVSAACCSDQECRDNQKCVFMEGYYRIQSSPQ